MIKKCLFIVVCGLFSLSATAEDTVYDFTLTSIDHSEMPMAQYKGKAILLVNTASECGFTPQYEGLQTLWDSYRDKGLIVLGVPSNDFGGQEPGSEEEIKEFCTINFDINFPMTEKMVVSGKEGNAAIYDWLAEKLGDASRPKWNFHKYLIGTDGTPIAFFPSQIKPNSDKLLAAVDSALK